MRLKLDRRQADCLAFITAYIDENGGISPSYDEIRVALGLNSKSMVARHVSTLVFRGWLRRLAGTRGFEVVHRAPPKRLTTVDALIMVGSVSRSQGAAA